MKNLDNCGCCEGVSKETPLKIYNRPNLQAITYRVGDHNKFRESLLTALSDVRFSALRRLSTRDNDDFTIALLDAWSTVLDVLTFYQERIANESYLGTATEQLSIVELARLIGYQLRPGVVASTQLAFTIEEATLTFGQIALTGNVRGKEDVAPSIIPIGSKVQSIPGPDEEPQTYETIEKIEARSEWNAMKPRLTQPQTDFSKIIVVKGTANDLKIGHILLLKDSSTLAKVVKVVLNEEDKTTTLYLKTDAKYPAFNFTPVMSTASTDIFKNKVVLDDKVVYSWLNNSTVIDYLLNNTWREEDLTTLIKSQSWSTLDLKESFARKLSTKAAQENAVFVFRKRAFPFGHNALKQVEYDKDKKIPKPPEEWALNEAFTRIDLDTTYEQILKGSYIAIQKPTTKVEKASLIEVQDVDLLSRTDYGMSTKVTRLSIASQIWWDISTPAATITTKAAVATVTDIFVMAALSTTKIDVIRELTIHAQSEPLTLAESPIQEDIQGDTIMLSGFFPSLKTGQAVMIFGERADLAGTYAVELKILRGVFVAKGFTTITLKNSLNYTYIRKTVTVNANVADATHGETVKEVLGSGDASKTFQKFILKQPPLTFTSASTPSGTQSTLEIRVNDLLWREVPSLYERGPNEHIYITRQDDLGKTTVTFGDGKNGARLPTGQENIRATYRKGIGVKGLLKAHQLSQLLSRPLGAKAVTNPLRTEGAQDKENLADARRNAALTIYTLDRIVSLQDYEDFARAFAGIAKSLATWTWYRGKRWVYLTVAGYNGAVVANNSHLYTHIQKASIPDVPVQLQSYTPVFFRVRANVKVLPDYESDKVFAAIETRLRVQFSFAERGFGQSVSQSEVITVMQNVAGVVAVNVYALHRSDKDAQPNDILFASAPSPDTLAELLTLDPQPLALNLMS